MKIISQEFSTALPTMTIKNSKELDLMLWLLRAIRLQSRFFQIQYYRDPILVIIPDEAIVCIGAVGDHVWQETLL